MNTKPFSLSLSPSLLPFQDEKVSLSSIYEIVAYLKLCNDDLLDWNAVYDKLLSHFFLKSCGHYATDNIDCLLRIMANDSSGVSPSILSYYLKQILEKYTYSGQGSGIKHSLNAQVS